MPVNSALKAYLETRRSIPAFQMGEPGPSTEEILEMLTLARRVPDHGKLAPWRFIVYRGEERERVSRDLSEIAIANNPDIPEEQVAGFIHIGTPQVPPTERARPELGDIVTFAGETDVL